MNLLNFGRKKSVWKENQLSETGHGNLSLTLQKAGSKKNDHAKNCVKTALKYKADHGINYTDSARELDTAYPTLMRYKSRFHQGKVLVGTPGPKLIRPPDPEVVNSLLEGLKPCVKRTHGTGNVIDSFRGVFTQESVYELTEMLRKEANKARRDNCEHLQWLIPGSVWSMDDTVHKLHGRKNHINHVIDLESSYKVGAKALQKHHSQKSVAEHLDRLFTENPPPLILKRDNGGNLRGNAVKEVLARHMVIPLISPAYFPQYNGAMESHQNHLKKNIEVVYQEKGIVMSYSTLVELAVQKCNHRRSSKRSKTTACQRFHANPFNMKKRKRKEVFEWIEQRTLDMGRKINHLTKEDKKVLRRLATEEWLEKNGFLMVSNRTKCKPFFGGLVYHY